MSSVFKAIAIWLIALIIPVQGMAAVAMPLCGPAHHAGLAEVTGHTAGADVAARPATNQHAAMNHAVQSDHDAGSAGGKSDHSGHPILKCCSAGCAMAAVMPACAVTRALAGSPAPLHPVAQFYRSVTPDGLDRPPKSFLA